MKPASTEPVRRSRVRLNLGVVFESLRVRVPGIQRGLRERRQSYDNRVLLQRPRNSLLVCGLRHPNIAYMNAIMPAFPQ